MSIRYQASSVSGFAAAANPSKAFRPSEGSPVRRRDPLLRRFIEVGQDVRKCLMCEQFLPLRLHFTFPKQIAAPTATFPEARVGITSGWLKLTGQICLLLALQRSALKSDSLAG
jgi:hypothetical protein